ncbi:MAG: TRAP transporter substrate-binding protein [Atribacterota bacterium]|nr:TRAP transporter substrate-binding protein [Atribacterota bacterium]
MKKIIALVLVIGLVTIFMFGICSSLAAEKTFTLKLAGIKNDEDPASKAMELFAEKVKKDSNGTIVVNPYTNSVLGNLNDLLSGMIDGTVDMLYNTLSCYSWLSDLRWLNITSAPFLWKDNKELQSFIDSPEVQRQFEEGSTSSGVRLLIANGELIPRQLSANRAIKNADDFKGLKIRTAEAPIVQAIMKKLGAVPVVIPFADLYMSLKTGVADAQENNFFTMKSSSFYEVQTHFMKTDYIRDVGAIFISDKIWNQMSDNQKKIMKDAAKEATDLEAKIIADTVEEVMAFLSTKMTYVEPDIASIQAKLGSDIYQEFDKEGKIWPTGTLDLVLKFKENYKD